MNNRNYLQQEQRIFDILWSNESDVTKSQEISKLGFDPEVADELVERHQIGARAPVYYERLDFADLDDTEELFTDGHEPDGR